MADVLTAHRHRLPPLQHLSETLGKRLCSLTHDLSREDVADGVHHHGRLLIAIVAFELGEILKTETHRHLVASRGGDKIVEPLEIYRGQLVDYHRRLQPVLLVNQLYDARIVKAEGGPVYILTVGVVPDTQDLGLSGLLMSRENSLSDITQYSCGEIIRVRGIFADAIWP